MGRRVLAQPVYASAAERNWSVYGKISSKERNRMGHAVGDKLVYCHEALHLKHVVHDARDIDDGSRPCMYDGDG